MPPSRASSWPSSPATEPPSPPRSTLGPPPTSSQPQPAVRACSPQPPSAVCPRARSSTAAAREMPAPSPRGRDRCSMALFEAATAAESRAARVVHEAAAEKRKLCKLVRGMARRHEQTVQERAAALGRVGVLERRLEELESTALSARQAQQQQLEVRARHSRQQRACMSVRAGCGHGAAAPPPST
eukprot:COSAG01_NODE_4032_length_5416_cov_11.025954_5_plen_185_part_00